MQHYLLSQQGISKHKILGGLDWVICVSDALTSKLKKQTSKAPEIFTNNFANLD